MTTTRPPKRTTAVCTTTATLMLFAVAMVWTTSAAATPQAVVAPPPVVVFEPGILGYKRLAGLGNYWGVVPDRLRDVAAIRAATGAQRVVIIAHSQGGLDVRAALDDIPGFAAQVGAVATLSSPHHGSPMADVGFALPQPLVHGVLQAMHSSFEANQGLTARPAAIDACLTSLSPAGAAVFNAAHPTSPVPFFSVAAVTGEDIDGSCATGRWGPPVVQDAAGVASLWNRVALKIMVGDVSNDGVVPTASMRFGDFLGCVPADHGDWMGWVSHPFEEELVWSATPFLVELAQALVDVDRFGPRAMTGHLPALSSWARSSSASSSL